MVDALGKLSKDAEKVAYSKKLGVESVTLVASRPFSPIRKLKMLCQITALTDRCSETSRR
jgi:hypothetical protein